MKVGAIFLLSLFFMGCTTSGKFIIPERSKLYIHERPVSPDSNGVVTMKPMFWTAAGCLLPEGPSIAWKKMAKSLNGVVFGLPSDLYQFSGHPLPLSIGRWV